MGGGRRSTPSFLHSTHSFTGFTGGGPARTSQNLCAHIGFFFFSFFFCGRRRHHESFTARGGKSLHLGRALCVCVCLSGLMWAQISSSDVVFSLGGSNLGLRAGEPYVIRAESAREPPTLPDVGVCVRLCVGLGGRLCAPCVSTSQFITNLLQMRPRGFAHPHPPPLHFQRWELRDVGGLNI